MAAMKEVLRLTPEEEEEACQRALQLSSVVIFPMTLKVAIELGLFEIIVGAGPGGALSAEEIAAQLPAKNPQAANWVDRLLCLLAANDVITCTVVSADGRSFRKYSMKPVCKYLITNEDASIAKYALLEHDKINIDIWHHVKESVLGGVHPVEVAYGMSAFEYMGTDPRFSKVFNEGMLSHSGIMIKQLLRNYNGFAGINVLVDVGGNDGATLRMITSQHPHVKGINFDLPHVISTAQPIPGVQHVSGDMFDSVPSGDAIFLKWILHDWSDDLCVTLLKNCRKSLPENGKVLVVEYIRPVAPAATAQAQFVFQLDLVMLAHCIGGKERTEEEFRALATEAGFAGFNAAATFAGMSVMEFTK
ncbi:unnamed protein product [Musa acuminata subsp. burmannicoides]